jgi:hypothetical protein
MDIEAVRAATSHMEIGIATRLNSIGRPVTNMTTMGYEATDYRAQCREAP